MPHLLILSSNTGGGHRACAKALKAAFEAKYSGQIRVSIVDLWSDHAPFPLNLLPSTYPFLIQHTPWIWRLLWHATKSSRLSGILFSIVTKWAGRHILTTLTQLNPDLIICVHPIVQRAVLASFHHPRHIPNPQMSAARDYLRTRPWFTVVTDLCASHPFWFHAHATRCFVDGATTAHHAEQLGVSPQNLYAYGLPIDPAFGLVADKFGENECGISARADLRRKLDMDPTLPAALIMGGGDGVGQVAQVADQIAKQLSTVPMSYGGRPYRGRPRGGSMPGGQLVVLCGHNESLLHSLQNRAWPIPVVLCGFVENVAEWMTASDCVVTKAGPSTIAESMRMGKPLMLMGFIPGQESENVAFVVQGGAGLYSAEPAEIARIVRSWLLTEPESRLAFEAAAKNLSVPQASEQIADEVMKFVI